ncbi:MAG: bifunctional phosphoribosylaminoimidazolecarboxamide formyltransferase/IMP cyclohydrolase, partial [Gammaproteobacteria bacterium]|nr:bifunctional phosphoribosylaminoimidazolecarboxamide formyltransferase/IMP cyclohydrolase [Gammaproteobacteria bacterium]
MIKIRRALVSVSDKSSLDLLGPVLAEAGVEILSTGGTARFLTDLGIAVTDVAAYTGFPEMMDGRVKTLHPKIHGGILGRRDTDARVMEQHGIAPIDLVVVNLYPFKQTVAKPDCDLSLAIENIDIGGPSMIRAAAKHSAAVAVAVDPDDYPLLIDALRSGAGMSPEQTLRLAAKAFAHTADYDAAVAAYLAHAAHSDEQADFPERLVLGFKRREVLRYGENPHQRAAFYVEDGAGAGSVAGARQLQGKALSFNNIADTDAALDCVQAFDQTACVIVKHANPCGVAIAATLPEAYEAAYRTDPTSAFGGIIAFNRALDADTAALIVGRQFVEVIAAPEIVPAALEILSAKGDLRVLETGQAPGPGQRDWDAKRVAGGLLLQDRDVTSAVPADATLNCISRRAPDDRELADLMFCWQVVKAVKSNAIVYARDGATVGIGAGQMSRVI